MMMVTRMVVMMTVVVLRLSGDDDNDGDEDSGYDRQEAVLIRPSCVPKTVLWSCSQHLWNSPAPPEGLGEQLLLFQSLFSSLLSM